jgi:hypothetical protein
MGVWEHYEPIKCACYIGSAGNLLYAGKQHVDQPVDEREALEKC